MDQRDVGAVFKRSIAALMSFKPLRPLGPPSLRVVQYALGLTRREIVWLGQPDRAAAADRIRVITTSFPTQTVGVDEAYLIRTAVLATTSIPGDLAEVGVFRGGTARVICEAKGARLLHLFDTFAGLPSPSERDAGFEAGQYACSLDEVRMYLADCENVEFYPGLFPRTGEAVKDKRFSFVHLDVDLYDSTLACLEFFYPRMNVGAMLVSHDFVTFRAVRQAFTDYFTERRQPVLEMTGNQCLVVKVSDA